MKELRLSRRWSQAELAERLSLSQPKLSQVESGNSSLTAEQFLLALRIFNVGASRFSASPQDVERPLQNALARLGADHLQESEEVLSSEHLEEVHEAIKRALVSGVPRLVTAIGPVIVRNVDRIGFAKLHALLADVGFERRLDWLLDNVRTALRALQVEQPRGPRARQYRRALAILDAVMEYRHSVEASARAFAPDVLDRGIRSKQTLDEVRQVRSKISHHWNVISSLTVDDFIAALRDAHGPA